MGFEKGWEMDMKEELITRTFLFKPKRGKLKAAIVLVFGELPFLLQWKLIVSAA